MIPAALVVLDQFPLLPNGKIDRRALPAPDRGRGVQAGELVAPRTPVEATLAEIWAEVLGVHQAGVHDNFFELGGHSLLATQVLSRVRRAFGVEPQLRTFFAEPTIASLAAAIERSQSSAPVRSSAGIQASARRNQRARQVLAQLEQLSDEEVQTMLQARKSSVTGVHSNDK
jgi:acyl carrier protein